MGDIDYTSFVPSSMVEKKASDQYWLDYATALETVLKNRRVALIGMRVSNRPDERERLIDWFVDIAREVDDFMSGTAKDKEEK